MHCTLQVTGASSGIGRATAIEFAKAGASVVVGARRLAELEKVVAEIKELGGQALAVKLDVTDEKDQVCIHALLPSSQRMEPRVFVSQAQHRKGDRGQIWIPGHRIQQRGNCTPCSVLCVHAAAIF